MDDVDGQRFGFLAHIGEAHFDVGIAVDDGPGFAAAAAIAADAAVEFVGWGHLSGAVEHFFDFFVGDFAAAIGDDGMDFGEIEIGLVGLTGLGEAGLLAFEILLELDFGFGDAAFGEHGAGAVDAAGGACVDFDEDAFVVFDVFEHFHAALGAVD